jgi:hypothetical protein
MKFWKLLLPFEKIPIMVIALLVLTLFLFQANNVLKGKKVLGILNDTILFLGFLSMSWGIAVQIYNLILGARAVAKATDVNPLLIRQGMQITLVGLKMDAKPQRSLQITEIQPMPANVCRAICRFGQHIPLFDTDPFQPEPFETGID